ncbi:TetR/AcrR family transcriptional regulator [Achromobacter sp. UMC71]|uniref:TetR/AcrR family transcriptional regulator n=1 Tax=Achromobacter sp. UMC71 TaxID=1862320 RepID=UPI001601A776|nr:TetR/AcrR family transcriptional regulator [Achromobacter sp. UMC71]MBB1624353.1 TetR family transcriptional regulator [Achromobacter sp. UMC71]
MRTKDFEPDDVADAAMHVFWRRGYAATSVQDLVDGTGLGRGSLYNAFGSKQGLYEAALRRYHDLTAANLELLARPGTARERIGRLLDFIVDDELREASRRGCLVANASLEMAGQDDTVAELVRRNFQRLEKALEKILADAQAGGEIDAGKSPRALARFIVTTIQGLRVVSKGNSPRERRQWLADVVGVALGAL